jgi:hypothetical protein
MRNSPQKVGVSFLHDFPVSTLALRFTINLHLAFQFGELEAQGSRHTCNAQPELCDAKAGEDDYPICSYVNALYLWIPLSFPVVHFLHLARSALE